MAWFTESDLDRIVFSGVLSVLLAVAYVVVVVVLCRKNFTHLPLRIGAVSHGAQILLATALVVLPQGTRPMYSTCLMFLVAVVAFLTGVRRAVPELMTKGNRLRGLVGLVVNLTPFFTGMLALMLVEWAWNLKFSP